MRAALLVVVFVTACHPPAPPRSPVALSFLGVAGWQLTAPAVTVLVDPYYSRVHTVRHAKTPGDDRPTYSDADAVPADTAVIDAHLPARVDAVLIEHAHFDHILDTPYIARKTGALVIANESGINLCRASGVPRGQLITVKGGEDYRFAGGAWSVAVVPGLHTANDDKRYFQSGTLPADVKVPLPIGQYLEGGTFAFLVRTGGHKVFFLGSANFIERELIGLEPTVAVLSMSGRDEIHDYTCRLLRALGHPPTVIVSHFDRMTVPYDRPMEGKFADAEAFAREVVACAPGTEVIIPREYFKPILVE